MKLSEADEVLLVDTAINNRRISIRELSKQFRCHVITIRKILDKHGYHKRVARRKPYLKESHKAERLLFAEKHQHWKPKHWARVMFTDECNIELGLDGRVYWIWRRADESLENDCLKPTFKSGRTSVGIWSFIFQDIKGPLVLIDGRMNGQQYVDKVLKAEVLKTAAHIEYNLGDWMFMHDGAPCHCAGIAKGFFKEEGITLMKWL
jgi:hypothetical protein